MENRTSSNSWQHWLETRAQRFLLFARVQTRSEADAQDVLQEALVDSWRRQGHTPPPDPMVFATIRRRAIDLARSNQRRAAREEVAEHWFVPTTPLEGETELESALMALPDSLREVLVLKIFGEVTFEQVASTLGIPLPTAASRYRYALERLRSTMKGARA